MFFEDLKEFFTGTLEPFFDFMCAFFIKIIELMFGELEEWMLYFYR